MTFQKQRCIVNRLFQATISPATISRPSLFCQFGFILVVLQSLLLKVDLDASVVDPELKQMTIRYKHGGVIEELLG